MIKITGTRSLQNKLSRVASDFSYDAARVLSGKPELAHIADRLQVLANEIELLALRLSKES